MLAFGVFCGKYMTDWQIEVPASSFARAKLSLQGRDCALNYFGIDASQPLSVWRRKAWIHPDDPRGWFQWYCRYYMGRRMPDEDTRQIKGGRRSAVTWHNCDDTASWRSDLPPAPAPGFAALGLRQPRDLNALKAAKEVVSGALRRITSAYQVSEKCRLGLKARLPSRLARSRGYAWT